MKYISAVSHNAAAGEYIYFIETERRARLFKNRTKIRDKMIAAV